MEQSLSHTIDTTVKEGRLSVVEKVMAYFFSIVFHPLFIPTMMVAYLAYLQAGYYIGIPTEDKNKIILRVAVNTIFFPGVTVLLLKGLGFAKSIFLRSQKERIIPYVASNIFYFWIFLVFKNQPEVPPITTSAMLGVFLSSSIGLIANSYYKISMHALGMGAFTGLMLVIIFSGFPFGTFLPLMILLILTGIVCSSRLMISDHKPFDIYSAIIISILCQVIAYVFVTA